eukprot:1161299-Pelagomonas_calceolata.AAC.16
MPTQASSKAWGPTCVPSSCGARALILCPPLVGRGEDEERKGCAEFALEAVSACCSRRCSSPPIGLEL